MWKRLLIPFSSRNYQLYFSGQIVSLVGSWMTQTTTVWLVYHLTQSAFLLGCVGFIGQAPTFLLAPFAGVWVDRLDRVKLLMITQVLAMLQSLTLAVLTLTGHISFEILAVLAVVQGVINAFDMPTRQSMMVLLAEKREHLSAVIGMNSSMFSLSRLVGPALAGFVIAKFGPGYCFLIDGLSYIAVLTAIAFMHLKPPVFASKVASVWADLSEGVRYVYHHRPIRTSIILAFGMALSGLSFGVLMPAYAQTVFGGDPMTLGLLMSSTAAGAVIAALSLAMRKGILGIGRVIVSGAALAGVGLVIFANSTTLWVAIPALLATGTGAVLVMASNNTLIQNMVEEDKRGRVMSLFTCAFLGGVPLGSLIIGSAAHTIGLTAATSLNGAACLLIAAWFLHELPKLRVEGKAALIRSGALKPDIQPEIAQKEPSPGGLAG